MILIDTNILVYATVPGFDEHRSARALLEAILAGAVQHCLTWINVFEYLRIVTHRRLIRPTPLPIRRAPDHVSGPPDHPRLSRNHPGPNHLATFARVCREAAPVEGNFVHDCRIAAVMRDNDVREVLTRDTSFRRIPGLTVTDPLA